MDLSLKMTGKRRELVLTGLLAAVALMAFWYGSSGEKLRTPVASPSGAPKVAGSAGGLLPIRPGAALHLDRLRNPQTQGEATAMDAEHRNPFVFPRPRPKINPDAPPPIPPKPRPVADYLGYLLSNGMRIAVIKMNNDVQVVPQGERLPSGYVLFQVDPQQIVLKDSDGESYTFRLPE